MDILTVHFTQTSLTDINNYHGITAVCPVDKVLAWLAIRLPTSLAGQDGTNLIKMVSFAKHEILRQFVISSAEVTQLVYSPMHKKLYAVLANRTLNKINVTAGNLTLDQIKDHVMSETQPVLCPNNELYFAYKINGNQHIVKTFLDGEEEENILHSRSLLDREKVTEINRCEQTLKFALLADPYIEIYDSNFDNHLCRINSQSQPCVFLNNILLIPEYDSIRFYSSDSLRYGRVHVSYEGISITSPEKIKWLKKWENILWVIKSDQIKLFILANS